MAQTVIVSFNNQTGAFFMKEDIVTLHIPTYPKWKSGTCRNLVPSERYRFVIGGTPIDKVIAVGMFDLWDLFVCALDRHIGIDDRYREVRTVRRDHPNLGKNMLTVICREYVFHDDGDVVVARLELSLIGGVMQAAFIRSGTGKKKPDSVDSWSDGATRFAELGRNIISEAQE
jgi:hypothetical protein